MSAIKQFLTGRGTTAVTIHPCTVDAAGTLTVGTGNSLVGRTESVKITATNTTDVIMSVDDVVENHVSLYDGYTIELSEILVYKVGSLAPVLPAQFFGANYFKVVITKGGVTYTLFGLRQRLEDGINGAGKQVSSLTLVPVSVTGDFSISYA